VLGFFVLASRCVDLLAVLWLCCAVVWLQVVNFEDPALDALFEEVSWHGL
jgi:hypothetical protein